MIRLYFTQYIGRVCEEDKKANGARAEKAWSMARPDGPRWSLWGRRRPSVELVSFSKVPSSLSSAVLRVPAFTLFSLLTPLLAPEHFPPGCRDYRGVLGTGAS